jgi:O-antigen ligase
VSRFFGLGIAGVVLWLLSKYPVAPIPLALVLGVYAAVLVRWPRSWLIVIPAVVPALDLVPWSGWFYWESVDFFLAVTLMVPLLGSWRTLPPVPLPGAALVALLALSYAVSLVHGLLPPTPLDANAFSNYWSPYNALRVAKGFVWALLLLPVARVTLNDRAAFRDFLFPGLILGFLGVMTVLIYERQVFSGLLNFSNQFRVTGSFSSMHTGGGHIEAYLSLVLPFILAYLLSKRAPWVSLAAAPLLALAGYGLAVSFARAALLGLGVGLAIMTLGVLIYSRTAHGRHRLRLAATLGLGLVALFAVALPIVKGDYFKERLGQVERDLETRTAHWSGAVNMMTPGAGTVLLGMGLGTFPVTYLLAQSASTRPATFRFVGTDQGRFLNLTAGDSLYYEQIVRILPHRTYRLAMDLRTRNPAPGLTVPICAKSLLYSYDCKWLGVPDIRGDGNWHRYQVDFDSGELGAGPWYSRRPTKLSLYSTTGGEGIDIDNIQLVAVDGVDLVRNGDFAQANAHWFFSTDNHLPWHVKDLWVAIYFEQGLLGVAAFLLFSGFVLLRLTRIVLGGDLMATGFLAGLAGFLAVGLFDSMFDVPRLSFLFYMLCFAALLLPEEAGDRRRN